MWMILLGVAAAMIGGFGVTSQSPPQVQPPDQYELQMAHVGGGIVSEPRRMEPFSEFKYRHIVRQAYDYSCGSAALVTVYDSAEPDSTRPWSISAVRVRGYSPSRCNAPAGSCSSCSIWRGVICPYPSIAARIR